MNASSSAWVGCSWVPSPALTTLERTQPEFASRCGAPLAPWRTTTASAPIASRVSAVSLRLSPLDSDEPLAAKLMTSAESRLAAASNEMRVRVESSKNRLTTVRPRSAGSFLIGRSASERSSSAVREHQLGVVAAQVGRAEQVPLHASAAPSIVTASTSSTPCEADPHPLDQRGGEVLADEVGADRQLAVAAVDQHGQPHRLRAADVVQRVERGADGAPGEEHVVDEDDGLAVDAARRDLGGQQRAGRLHPQVVAVHRDVERADRHVVPLDGGDPLGDPLGQRHAPAGDAEQDEVLGALVALEDLVGDAGEGPGDVGASSTMRAASVGRGGGLLRWAQASCRTSFSASRDGSLKDVDRSPPYSRGGWSGAPALRSLRARTDRPAGPHRLPRARRPTPRARTAPSRPTPARTASRGAPRRP